MSLFSKNALDPLQGVGTTTKSPINLFGNAFYSVGSGLIRGGLGKHECSDLQFLFPLNPNNTILAIRIAQQNSEIRKYFSDPQYYFQVNDHACMHDHWTITEPVGGQHSYKPPIYGICYKLSPYRHLIRSIRKSFKFDLCINIFDSLVRARVSPEGPVSPSSATGEEMPHCLSNSICRIFFHRIVLLHSSVDLFVHRHLLIARETLRLVLEEIEEVILQLLVFCQVSFLLDKLDLLILQTSQAFLNLWPSLLPFLFSSFLLHFSLFPEKSHTY
ncbi:hypothetical protein CXB51_016460 [Gossypium anomalum]|uniref:Uncharacterized protein n=1 Tax=Gossypium anomalum TaxID=47600 RepID=A0A8J5Z493_9ROSI|nr:hypothetical protein CXB51_016460 [Gossypium anomalum]